MTRPGSTGRRRDVERGALDHYRDPELYTRTYRRRREDVAFYVEAAARLGGPVLEYGVGNGRVAVPVARRGVEVVGVDRSAPMLEDLGRRAKRLGRRSRALLSWIRADMRTARLGRRFPLVIAPFNTVLHLYSRRDIEQFLAGVREHLAPGGTFIFDFSIPLANDLMADPEEWVGSRWVRAPGKSGERRRYRERFEYDPLSQVLLVEMRYEATGGEADQRVVLTHRQFFPREMEALLYYNGFRNLRFRGDFGPRVPGSDVDSIVVEACRPE